MRLADNELYLDGVWGLYVPWRESAKEANTSSLSRCLAVLNALCGEPWMCGAEFSLADAYLVAMLDYIALVPAGRSLLESCGKLKIWLPHINGRESIQLTRYPPQDA